MPKRCGDAECGNLVNERKPGVVNHGDRIFCDEECERNWYAQSKLFEQASDPFHTKFERRTPKRMNGG